MPRASNHATRLQPCYAPPTMPRHFNHAPPLSYAIERLMSLDHFTSLFEFKPAHYSNQSTPFASCDSSHGRQADRWFPCSCKHLCHATRKAAYTAQRLPQPCLRDRLFSLLSSICTMSTDSADPEKGLISSTSRPAIPLWTPSAPGNANHSCVHTPLQLFQLLIGIHTPPSLTQDGENVGKSTEAESLHGRSDNIGLYQRAKQHERRSRIQYKCTSVISHSLYMVQILLAATFTALSSYKDTDPVTLTVLGAANTVIAG
jgi:hypothetical protein